MSGQGHPPDSPGPSEGDRQEPPGRRGNDFAGLPNSEVSGEEVMAHEHALPRQGERDLEPDVERIHRPILREQPGPTEGRELVPWWVWVATAAAIFWGGWYLGQHGGTFGIEAHRTFSERTPFTEREAQEQTDVMLTDPVRAGQTVYERRCQTCHQASGLGVPGVFPPVIGSEWETGPPEFPVLIVLHGLQGPIEVAGATYSGVMPAWQDQLSDPEIAAVVTFIRQWETNDAGPVPPELVAQLRAATAERTAPWTAEELRAFVPGP